MMMMRDDDDDGDDEDEDDEDIEKLPCVQSSNCATHQSS